MYEINYILNKLKKEREAKQAEEKILREKQQEN